MAGFFKEFGKGYREVIPKKVKKKEKKKPLGQKFGQFAAKSIIASKSRLKESAKAAGAGIAKGAKTAGSNFLANAAAEAQRQREERKKKKPFSTGCINEEVDKMHSEMFKFP